MLDRVPISTSEATDQECLVCWRRQGQSECLRPILERYTASVFSHAHTTLGNSDQAARVTQVVFLVMARRRVNAANLERWLVKITLISCRRFKRRSFSWVRECFERKAPPSDLLPLPDSLGAGILRAIETAGRKRPQEEFAKWVLRKLFWARWRRRVAIAAFLLVVLGTVLWRIEERRGYSGLICPIYHLGFAIRSLEVFREGSALDRRARGPEHCQRGGFLSHHKYLACSSGIQTRRMERP